MKIFSSSQIKQIDKYTIENEPILSVNLMERAVHALFNWIRHRFQPEPVVVFAGPGNNGGDALALSRLMTVHGWDVRVYILHSDHYSDDFNINYERLGHMAKIQSSFICNEEDVPSLKEGQLIIDGLFGSGLNRTLAGLPAKIVESINRMNARVISIDIPSGLMGESNAVTNRESVVKADYTLTFQFPKLSFLFPENDPFLGEWHVLDIGLHPEAIEHTQTMWHLITGKSVKTKIPVRDKFAHKGKFGHALLISGSYGMMGAAVLSSKACLKTGVGLLTTHVPHYGYNILQTAVPEAMVSIDRSDILISEFPDLQRFDAIGIGPAIGTKTNTCKTVSELLDHVNQKPLVIDADAINIIAMDRSLLEKLPPGAILTPHPKEFERLAGKWSDDYDRLNKLIEFCCRYQVVTVLKGAHTTIALPDGSCYFNSTGNPGMASAGSGDVLTGMILALRSQGLSAPDAAMVGVYLHGIAGDIYAATESEESLTAVDLIHSIGKAFRKVRES